MWHAIIKTCVDINLTFIIYTHVVVAVIVGLCIILSFKKTNKSKFQVLGMEGIDIVYWYMY